MRVSSISRTGSEIEVTVSACTVWALRERAGSESAASRAAQNTFLLRSLFFIVLLILSLFLRELRHCGLDDPGCPGLAVHHLVSGLVVKPLRGIIPGEFLIETKSQVPRLGNPQRAWRATVGLQSGCLCGCGCNPGDCGYGAGIVPACASSSAEPGNVVGAEVTISVWSSTRIHPSSPIR